MYALPRADGRRGAGRPRAGARARAGAPVALPADARAGHGVRASSAAAARRRGGARDAGRLPGAPRRRAGYRHYEVSAYARPGRECRHNLNYWRFGDYLGIGAGAHGKLTDAATGTRRAHRARQAAGALPGRGAARRARRGSACGAAGGPRVRVLPECAAPARGIRRRAVRGAHRPAVVDLAGTVAAAEAQAACSRPEPAAAGCRPSSGSGSSTTCRRCSCRTQPTGAARITACRGLASGRRDRLGESRSYAHAGSEDARYATLRAVVEVTC